MRAYREKVKLVDETSRINLIDLEISEEKFDWLLVGFDQVDRGQIYQYVKILPFRIENSVSSHIDRKFILPLPEHFLGNFLSKKLDFYSLLIHQWDFKANGLETRVPRLRKLIVGYDKTSKYGVYDQETQFQFSTNQSADKQTSNSRSAYSCFHPFRIENRKNYLYVEKNHCFA